MPAIAEQPAVSNAARARAAVRTIRTNGPSSGPSRRPAVKRPAVKRPAVKHPRVYDFVLFRMNTFGNGEGPLPTRLLLLRHPNDPQGDQLFLDQVPIRRDAWHYDAADRQITWHGAYGGGHLHLSHDGRGGVGNIGPALSACAVTAGATAVFDCDVAANTGAGYVTSGSTVTGYTWDTTAAPWKAAAWEKRRLRLSYTVTTSGPILPPVFQFEFTDNGRADSLPWDPDGAEAALGLSQFAGQTVWNLTFAAPVVQPPDGSPPPAGSPDSVFPYRLEAREDAAAATIDGVLQIDAPAPQGTLLGFQGVRARPDAGGYYRAAAHKAPFGVFDGKLVIGGKPLATSQLSGAVLRWTDLAPDHQFRTGLPQSGALRFREHGITATGNRGLAVQRLATHDALAALARHADLHPQAHARHVEFLQALDASPLTVPGLMEMRPIVQDEHGAWADVVQNAVMQDMSAIMNSSIPADIWQLLFPNQTQQELTGELAAVAASPVKGFDDPKAWYGTLATAVLAQGMAGGSDVNTLNMNGPRAGAWLKQQVAASPVYNAHSQLLFNYEWQAHFPLFAQYLADQAQNRPDQAAYIDAQIQSSVDDINLNVAVDPTHPTLKQDLITEVQAVGAYAKTNKLFWAFAFLNWNTSPAVLVNIQLSMAVSTGSSDGTTLTRMFQQNVAILTALDPSNYFTQQYIKTLNIFLATNILPSMFGFLDDAMSFTLLKAYLQKFVDNNLANEDKEIAAAAAQIQQILADQHADDILRASIDAVRSFSGAIQDALALPFIAKDLGKWLADNHPTWLPAANVFGSLLIGGLTMLGVFNLVSAFKKWDQLTDAEKASVVDNAVQFGLQIVAAVVKRGVRIYAIFQVDGLTAMQRLGAVNKILLTGEATQLDEGLMKIGNTTARWLGDTEGSLGLVAVAEDELLVPLLGDAATVAIDDMTWAATILGRNLEEFIATRLGPLFALAGIGISIWLIATGETGIALAAEILNIVSSSLMIFATVGGWMIQVGWIAAEGVLSTIISVAGPLAILAALAGVALMLYELFKQQPDPVQEFVDGYVKPTGFYVAAQASAIDYALNYSNPDQNKLLMIGFSLSANGQFLTANADGTLSLGPVTSLPDCVWLSATDGLGMTKIATVIQKDAAEPPAPVYLSLMSDKTVSFQPALATVALPSSGSGGGSTAAALAARSAPIVLTQTWLSTPQGSAALTSTGGYLAALNLVLQPVLPNMGSFAPAGALGFLTATAAGVGFSTTTSTTFTLRMSGMAPNYMRMADLSFSLNTMPSVTESYAPNFGVNPSTPFKYIMDTGLPAFLALNAQTGQIQPNGGMATPASQGTYTISVQNALGVASTNFTLAVAAPSPAPGS